MRKEKNLLRTYKISQKKKQILFHEHESEVQITNDKIANNLVESNDVHLNCIIMIIRTRF